MARGFTMLHPPEQLLMARATSRRCLPNGLAGFRTKVVSNVCRIVEADSPIVVSRISESNRK